MDFHNSTLSQFFQFDKLNSNKLWENIWGLNLLNNQSKEGNCFQEVMYVSQLEWTEDLFFSNRDVWRKLYSNCF